MLLWWYGVIMKFDDINDWQKEECWLLDDAHGPRRPAHSCFLISSWLTCCFTHGTYWYKTTSVWSPNLTAKHSKMPFGLKFLNYGKQRFTPIRLTQRFTPISALFQLPFPSQHGQNIEVCLSIQWFSSLFWYKLSILMPSNEVRSPETSNELKT